MYVYIHMYICVLLLFIAVREFVSGREGGQYVCMYTYICVLLLFIAVREFVSGREGG